MISECWNFLLLGFLCALCILIMHYTLAPLICFPCLGDATAQDWNWLQLMWLWIWQDDMYNDEVTKSVMKHLVFPEPQITGAMVSLHITFRLSESNRLFEGFVFFLPWDWVVFFKMLQTFLWCFFTYCALAAKGWPSFVSLLCNTVYFSIIFPQLSSSEP